MLNAEKWLITARPSHCLGWVSSLLAAASEKLWYCYSFLSFNPMIYACETFLFSKRLYIGFDPYCLFLWLPFKLTILFLCNHSRSSFSFAYDFIEPFRLRPVCFGFPSLSNKDFNFESWCFRFANLSYDDNVFLATCCHNFAGPPFLYAHCQNSGFLSMCNY